MACNKQAEVKVLSQVALQAQFALEINKYLDFNMFLQPNRVKSTVERWSFSPKENELNFIDFQRYTQWVSEEYRWNTTVSRDNGQTYNSEVLDLYFGCYYFLSEERVEHVKVLYGIKNIIPVVGSLASLILSILRLLLVTFNRN